MSKKSTLVQIPVGYVCVSLEDIQALHRKIDEFRNYSLDLRGKARDLDVENESLKAKLADAEKKIAELQNRAAELEKEVSQKQDRVMYWYNECEKLQKQIAAVKPDAEAEET